MSAGWVELLNGRKELRVCDEAWFHVNGNEVVLSPSGISRGRYATHGEAIRQAERMYRQHLEAQETRGAHLVMTARAGLRMLAALSSEDATRPTGDKA